MSFTAEQILSFTQPEQLFKQENCEAQWRKLRSKWHPDHGVDNAKVFAVIKDLYEKALENISKGIWNIPGEVHFTAMKTGSVFHVKYKKKHLFELGEVYIGNGVVAYALTEENADLFAQGVKMIKSLKYPDPKFKKEADRFFPKILGEIETIDRHVLVLEKGKDTVLLRDLLDYMGGTLDSKHAAWVVSRLCNIHCLLNVAGVMHADISPDTCFISPSDHRIDLLGGWWYAQKLDAPIKAAPSRTLALDIIPDDRPRAEPKITSELVLATGRECLGDLHGSKLAMNKTLKPAMSLWLRTTPAGNPVKEYSDWYKVLEKDFGKRKFVEFVVSLDDIYKDAK